MYLIKYFPSQMPRLTSDEHEWINMIPTVSTHLETTNKIGYAKKVGRKNSRKEERSNEEGKLIQRRRENKLETVWLSKTLEERERWLIK